MQGKVKFFDADRGFGFIQSEGREDVFVHVSNLQPGTTVIAEGQSVEFDIGPGRKSDEAKNVRADLSRPAELAVEAGGTRFARGAAGGQRPRSHAIPMLG